MGIFKWKRFFQKKKKKKKSSITFYPGEKKSFYSWIQPWKSGYIYESQVGYVQQYVG